jgi:hypothetical protein
MATGASFGLYGHMLVDERPLLVDMALVANGIAARHCPELPHRRCSMSVMAVIALQQTFVHPVVVGFGEIRFGRGVTSIAQLGLAQD